jgi:hypothetical protein
MNNASLDRPEPRLGSPLQSTFLMRRVFLRTLLAALLVAPSAAALAHDDAAASHAAQRAEAAEEALSARYTAIWRTLDAAQKATFSARERAWLNGGRQIEQRVCIAHAGADTALIARNCAATVVERHLAALDAVERVPLAAH